MSFLIERQKLLAYEKRARFLDWLDEQVEHIGQLDYLQTEKYQSNICCLNKFRKIKTMVPRLGGWDVVKRDSNVWAKAASFKTEWDPAHGGLLDQDGVPDLEAPSRLPPGPQLWKNGSSIVFLPICFYSPYEHWSLLDPNHPLPPNATSPFELGRYPTTGTGSGEDSNRRLTTKIFSTWVYGYDFSGLTYNVKLPSYTIESTENGHRTFDSAQPRTQWVKGKEDLGPLLAAEMYMNTLRPGELWVVVEYEIIFSVRFPVGWDTLSSWKKSGKDTQRKEKAEADGEWEAEDDGDGDTGEDDDGDEDGSGDDDDSEDDDETESD